MRRSRQSRKVAVLVLTVLLVLTALLGLGCRKSEPWNVVLVTFDTTRADRLGAYGRTTAVTPTLDALAAEGFLFERCRSAAPVTLPSHSTLLTGTYPNVHGVRDNSVFALPPASVTLAEVLREHGYRTAAAVGSFVLDHQFGVDQGFELYDDAITQEHEDYWGRRTVDKLAPFFFDERPAERVNAAVLPWLRERLARPGEPFFVWLHYWDPHHPHIPPAPYNQLFATDLYQGEIANADAALGRVIGELRRADALERTLVVMTADHGEGEGEHGEETHSLLAYDTTLHVPLIVRVP
ncbi:MAG: sulfatase, partial [Planctomycetes bacterium]|nr:sulfatase [Planctomycetota bacterium]